MILMDEKQVLEVVRGGETQTVEFKRAASKDVGKTICAFSNAGGGMLLLGVEDNGTIIGVPSAKLDEIQQQIYHSQ
jgi:ATP-dependent DNA helicase RecG